MTLSAAPKKWRRSLPAGREWEFSRLHTLSSLSSWRRLVEKLQAGKPVPRSARSLN